jgi:glycosyltransferase involved in cell wall biosynthesis
VDELKQVLVPTMNKSFWISEESKIFPNILYSTDKKFRSYMGLFIRSILFILKKKPKIVILGSDLRVKQGFAVLRYLGLFKKIKFVSINMNAVPYFMTKNWRKVIYFTRNEIIERGKILAKYNAPGDQGVFSNNPVDGDLNLKSEKVDEEYAICVGSNRRDFTSVINAFDGLGLKLVIRKPPQTPLNFEGDLPSYCEVGHRPKQEYLQEVKSAKFIIVPLLETWKPHGHMAIIQAKCLGKVVISTKRSSVDDYITDGVDGFLVEPGAVSEYRKCFETLIHEDTQRKQMEKAALETADLYSYSSYQNLLINLCQELIEEDE